MPTAAYPGLSALSTKAQGSRGGSNNMLSVCQSAQASETSSLSDALFFSDCCCLSYHEFSFGGYSMSDQLDSCKSSGSKIRNNDPSPTRPALLGTFRSQGQFCMKISDQAPCHHVKLQTSSRHCITVTAGHRPQHGRVYLMYFPPSRLRVPSKRVK